MKNLELNTEIVEQTNDLRYSTMKTKGGYDYYIKIRLNDECKNGHQDFAITADYYKAGAARTDRNYEGGGAMGDKLAKLFPEFAIFNDLHLCDYKGAPMYAHENGFYHLKNSTYENAKNYVGATDTEMTELLQCDDSLIYAYKLIELGIVARWQETANKGIVILEQWTGKKFVIDSVREQFIFTPENRAEVEKRIKEGYYTPTKTNARRRAKDKAIRDKKYADILERKNREIEKETNEYNIKKFVLDSNLEIDDFIYYSHINTGVFNWSDRQFATYKIFTTKEQFNKFMEGIEQRKGFNKLPKGIKFEIKHIS